MGTSYAASSQSAFPTIAQVIQKQAETPAKDIIYSLTAQFFGYRAKEDVTALPAGFLVSPSQNVLTNSAGLVYARPGYTLYGQAAVNQQVVDGIRSSYDWLTHNGYEMHLREHTGAVEWAYTAPNGTVSWLPMMNQNLMSVWEQGSDFFRYAEYWNPSENVDELIFVNGDGNIYRWNGAQAAFAAASSAALSLNPFLFGGPPSNIFTLAAPVGTTLSGTSSNPANYVLCTTLTGPGTDVGIPVALIIFTAQPNPGDQMTLTVNGQTVTITFVQSPYQPPWETGQPSGSVCIGYTYTNIGSSTIQVWQPDLSSPSMSQTMNNLLDFFTNPGLPYSAFYVGNQTYANILSPLAVNTNPIITGSTTTAGNVISGQGPNLTYAMINNPSNGDTATFIVEGQAVPIQFVSVIGTTPGNVLIEATPALTLANVEALWNAPGTTNSTQVAFSLVNQYIVSLFTGVISTGITIQGQESWADLGFYTGTTGMSVIIDGAAFAYTGGTATQTITGVTPNPTTSITIHYGDPIIQAPISTPWSSVTGVSGVSTTDGFVPNLISNMTSGGSATGNSVFYGSTTRRDFYMAKQGNYADITFSDPRLPTDGYTFTADAPLTAFIVQETTMYVSAGPDWWYTVALSNYVANPIVGGTTVSIPYQLATLTPLKTSPGQGALSQEGAIKVKNSILIITQEPAIDDLGRIADDLALPEAITITDSIKNDFLLYDFTGATGLYLKYFFFITLPAEDKLLVYNFSHGWWEAPQTFGFSRLARINGDLYAHSSYIPETYRVFIDNPLDPDTVYSDNGNPINCIAYFAYQNFGFRAQLKTFQEMYIEGYISSNTTLSAGIKYDFGGFSGEQTFSLAGNNQANLFYTFADNSLGKVPIGFNPIGSVTDSVSNMPKFRHIFVMQSIDFYEGQFFFQSNDVDQQWSLLAFGPNENLSDSDNNAIRS